MHVGLSPTETQSLREDGSNWEFANEAAYTPGIETVPPLRQAMMACRSVLGLSVSSIRVCLARP